MALSTQLTEVIFAKLALTYGKHFPDQYPGHSPDRIKGHWAHELDSMPDHAIRYALEHLPADWPPNVLQFRQLCNAAPQPMRAQLPPPRGARIRPQVKQKLADLVERIRNQQVDPLAGARSLRAKERAGILLTLAQKQFWRQALHREMEAEARERTANEDVQ